MHNLTKMTFSFDIGPKKQTPRAQPYNFVLKPLSILDIRIAINFRILSSLPYSIKWQAWWEGVPAPPPLSDAGTERYSALLYPWHGAELGRSTLYFC